MICAETAVVGVGVFAALWHFFKRFF